MSVVPHYSISIFYTDNTTWKLSGRVGLLDNSEDWGLAAGVSWTWDGLKHLMDENE
jgi:hypothetical protein